MLEKERQKCTSHQRGWTDIILGYTSDKLYKTLQSNAFPSIGLKFFQLQNTPRFSDSSL